MVFMIITQKDREADRRCRASRFIKQGSKEEGKKMKIKVIRLKGIGKRQNDHAAAKD
jgi:hypothetical protein